MAKHELLIPFILTFEAGLREEERELALTAMFERAKKKGFANDPADKGGATMCGVTIATYRSWRRTRGYSSTTVDDLKAITFAEWREIFKGQYWNRWKGDSIECQALANLLVDFVWASGANGIRIPQRVLGVTVDGVVGLKTLAALNSADPRELFERLKSERIRFVEGIVKRNPTQAKFLKGWKRRINDITFEGLRYE